MVENVFVVGMTDCWVDWDTDSTYLLDCQVYHIPFRAVCCNQSDAVAFLDAQLQKSVTYRIGKFVELLSVIFYPLAIDFTCEQTIFVTIFLDETWYEIEQSWRYVRSALYAYFYRSIHYLLFLIQLNALTKASIQGATSSFFLFSG